MVSPRGMTRHWTPPSQPYFTTWHPRVSVCNGGRLTWLPSTAYRHYRVSACWCSFFVTLAVIIIVRALRWFDINLEHNWRYSSPMLNWSFSSDLCMYVCMYVYIYIIYMLYAPVYFKDIVCIGIFGIWPNLKHPINHIHVYLNGLVHAPFTVDERCVGQSRAETGCWLVFHTWLHIDVVAMHPTPAVLVVDSFVHRGWHVRACCWPSNEMIDCSSTCLSVWLNCTSRHAPGVTDLSIRCAPNKVTHHRESLTGDNLSHSTCTRGEWSISTGARTRVWSRQNSMATIHASRTLRTLEVPVYIRWAFCVPWNVAARMTWKTTVRAPGNNGSHDRGG